MIRTRGCTVLQTAALGHSATDAFNGPAARNRTWIKSLEGFCTIHCTTASTLGGPGETRTHCPPIMSRTLIPIKLPAHETGATGRNRTGTTFVGRF